MSNVVKLKPRPEPQSRIVVTTIVQASTLPTDDEIAVKLKAKIAEYMLPPDNIIVVHGKMQRFPSHTKRSNRDGWYVIYIHATHIAGAFGCWYTKQKHKWRIE